MIYNSNLNNFPSFFVYSCLWLAYIKTSTPPGIKQVQASLFIFSTNQIRCSNRISHPASSHEIFRRLSKSFAYFFRFFIRFWKYLYKNIVYWLSKFPLCYFICGFVRILRYKFMIEFVLCIGMIERVSSLLKYNVYMHHACTASTSLQVQD